MNNMPDWLYIAFFIIALTTWSVIVLHGIYKLGLIVIRLWKGHKHD